MSDALLVIEMAQADAGSDEDRINDTCLELPIWKDLLISFSSGLGEAVSSKCDYKETVGAAWCRYFLVYVRCQRGQLPINIRQCVGPTTRTLLTRSPPKRTLITLTLKW
jgi:hypothetical protein